MKYHEVLLIKTDINHLEEKPTKVHKKRHSPDGSGGGGYKLGLIMYFFILSRNKHSTYMFFLTFPSNTEVNSVITFDQK